MPTLALHYCPVAGCANKVAHGRCPVHAKAQEQARPHQEARRWYHTARWRALRRQKQQENPLCTVCQTIGWTTPWTDLDHVVPHKGDPGLFWDPANLTGLCADHHGQKTRRGE